MNATRLGMRKQEPLSTRSPNIQRSTCLFLILLFGWRGLAEATQTYLADGLRYVGPQPAIVQLREAEKKRKTGDGTYQDNMLRREALRQLRLCPVRTEEIHKADIQAAHEMESPRARILMDHLHAINSDQEFDPEKRAAYLSELVEAWRGLPGEDLVLVNLARLYREEPERRLHYLTRLTQCPHTYDRWGLLRQTAWQSIARIHEDQKNYEKAIQAVGNWEIDEPCGTGAGMSHVRRWTWLIRLRRLNGEKPSVLRKEAWTSLRTGELTPMWNNSTVAECLVDLYDSRYDMLLADAGNTLDTLENDPLDEDLKRWRRDAIGSPMGICVPGGYGHPVSFRRRSGTRGGTDPGTCGGGSRHFETVPVGSFPSNAWGLHDMHGNVQEWCKDQFSHAYYRSHGNIAVDPLNSDGRNRVIRGGGHAFSSSLLRSRSAVRTSYGPDSGKAGFRLVLVRELEPEP